MIHNKVKLIGGAAVFSGLLGLVAAGVWAINNPTIDGDAYVMTESSQDRREIPADTEFTGLGYTDFAPAPDPRLPVSLWLALPATTAAAGAIAGTAAAAAGFRIARHKHPDL